WTAADASKEPPRRGGRTGATHAAVRGAGVGAVPGVRRPARLRRQAVRLPGLRADDPSRDVAPGRRAARRSGRAPSLARTLLADRAQPDARTSAPAVRHVGTGIIAFVPASRVRASMRFESPHWIGRVGETEIRRRTPDGCLAGIRRAAGSD